MKLYKKDSKDKIREWEISTGKDAKGHFYKVTHGSVGGAMQEAVVYVLKGKNIGRSNETTPEEQCIAEADAKHQKQIDRKGYSKVIPEEKPNLPMLAHKYKDYTHKISWPAIGSIKIDGIRCIITIKDGVATCVSRTGKELVGLNHITEELIRLNKDDVVLDGELYSDTYSFEEIISIVRKSKSTDPRMEDIFFYAFDIINEKTYHERVVELDLLVIGLKHTKIVPWKILKTEEELYSWHKKLASSGSEGTMIRNITSLYQPNKRSCDLLKLKDFTDFEYKIIGWKVGKGRFELIPTFEFEMDNGKTFEAVPKGTDNERLRYLEEADTLIGLYATIRYFELTSDGIPRFPVMICIRNYE
ncbi:MAG TPA: hypothetical protein PKX31_00395 [Chitinophagaceae bacterium]|nr:hypothetical protein [Chitinophagaceae bacterium]